MSKPIFKPVHAKLLYRSAIVDNGMPHAEQADQPRFRQFRFGWKSRYAAAASEDVKNLGVLTGQQALSGRVSTDRPDRYYRIELATDAKLHLELSQLESDANLKLYRQNKDGSKTQLASSTKAGKKPEEINRDRLSAGVYVVRVKYAGSGQTDYTLKAMADRAGETLTTARDLGTLGQKSVTDFVGDADIEDYYRFAVNQPSNLKVAIAQLQGSVALEIGQDRNGNGEIETDEILQSVMGARNGDISIEQPLLEGTYYLRINGEVGETNYKLDLAATAAPLAVDRGGNTLAQAYDMGELTSKKNYEDFVGTLDPDDYYRFELKQTRRLKVTLSGLSIDADLQLIQDLNQNGKVDINEYEVLEYPFVGGNEPETIDTGLSPGVYYLRVAQYAGDTAYKLTATVETIILPERYSPKSGYGLVNVSAAIAQITQAQSFPSVASLGSSKWNLDAINAPEAWKQGYTGKGVVVAVVDTGIDIKHSDLDNNLWTNPGEVANNGIDDDKNGFVDDIHGWNFIDGNRDVSDRDAHGTHISGIIAAESNDFGATGVAYDAKLMPVKVLDDVGNGTADSIADGIRYAVNNGAHVINLSLSGAYSTDIEQAIEYATTRGTVVVMAAGNDYARSPGYPAEFADRWGIAVGSVGRDHRYSDFSNQAGYKAIDYVVAPGVHIYSTTPNNGYDFLDGTSMSTPHVTGAIALMLSAKPDLTPTQIRDIITATANPNGVEA
jgi:subtilisin family serine protease